MLKVDMKSKSVYMNCRSTMISASSHCLHAHNICTITAFPQTTIVTAWCWINEPVFSTQDPVSLLKVPEPFSKSFEQKLLMMTYRIEKLTFAQSENRIRTSFWAFLRAARICVLPRSPFQTHRVDEAFYERGLWFKRPPQVYLYWNECLICEKSSSSLQRSSLGTNTINWVSTSWETGVTAQPPSASSSSSEPNYHSIFNTELLNNFLNDKFKISVEL